MKARKYGFTLIEIITVITIIAVLISILIPSITAVKKMAKNTQQKAQINTIELAIGAFKNDYGDYPESDYWNLSLGNRDYTGAQMLAEALLGWDLMGFHPKSQWRADGKITKGVNNYADLYEIATNSSYPDPCQAENLRQRKGPYLDRGSSNAFKIEYVFEPLSTISANYFSMEPNSYVICDVFGFKKVTNSLKQTSMAGAPILYYKARTNSKSIAVNVRQSPNVSAIYDYRDNLAVILAKKYIDNSDLKKNTVHPLQDPAGTYKYFYEEYIRDKTVTDKLWPYRPDSYLLVSAGRDGEYGTEDDITNFE